MHAREQKESKASEALNEWATGKGFPGKWPCFFGRCSDTPDELASVMHPKSNVELMLSDRATRYRTKFERTVKDTGLVPVCRDCVEAIRWQGIFNE